MANMCDNIVYVENEDIGQKFIDKLTSEEYPFEIYSGFDDDWFYIAYETKRHPDEDDIAWLKENAGVQFAIKAIEPASSLAWDMVFENGELTFDTDLSDHENYYRWAFKNGFLDMDDYELVNGEYRQLED